MPPLPEDFNEWEHLQNTIRRVHNDAVRDFYRHQPDDDISTNRASAKHACLMKDHDTSTMTVLRFWLFWVVCRKMRDNFEPYYAVPITEYDSQVRYKPQITCFFQEDPIDVEPGYKPVTGEISVRVMGETSSTLTTNKLEALANKVNLAFGQGSGHVWRKGKELYSYGDVGNGFFFKVLARNQADAIEMIQKAIGIVDGTYNSKYLKRNEAVDVNSAYPTVPPTQIILGESQKEPRQRPIADVRFVHAHIKIWGRVKPKILVDKTGYWSEAILSAY